MEGAHFEGHSDSAGEWGGWIGDETTAPWLYPLVQKGLKI